MQHDRVLDQRGRKTSKRGANSEVSVFPREGDGFVESLELEEDFARNSHVASNGRIERSDVQSLLWFLHGVPRRCWTVDEMNDRTGHD
jgi:hypothetical protein